MPKKLWPQALLIKLYKTVPDKKIFCNTPWYELHIYWDGSLGICCQEDHKLYSGGDYNIASMTIEQWFNSPPVQQFRKDVLSNSPVSACRRCYVEEQVGGNSRRIKSNQKSAIFMQAFEESFVQSPGNQHFNFSGLTATQPIDIHIDLGNYCNLACKMCNAQASSKIAAQEVKWGIQSSQPYLGQDWTRDQSVWDSFKEQLLKIPKLNNIHFMGGETLLTDRFEDLVDFMIDNQRFDICFSFVTNGTVFNPELVRKLLKFKRVGIEVSIETIDKHNAYQRQGTDTDLVLSNIDRYSQYCNNTNITVTLRPAISALTIGYYDGLLNYALSKKIIIKSLLVIDPKFLSVNILPQAVKDQYLRKYHNILDTLKDISVQQDYNASDPNNFKSIIKEQAQMCINALNKSAPDDVDLLRKQMIQHCQKWDQIYGYDARSLYPEFAELLDRYDY